MKKQNGITLIALVITIIVLLILAGVSISMVTGDNGIASKAGIAKEQNDIKGLREEIELVLQDREISKSIGEELKSLKDDLSRINNAEIEEVKSDMCYISRNNVVLTVYDNGDVYESKIDLWDGNKIEAPDIKDGKWYIYNTAELKFFEEIVNKGESELTIEQQETLEAKNLTEDDITINVSTEVHLMADLDLGARQSNGELISGTEWIPIGKTNALAFKGIFKGNNHVIKGVYVKKSDALAGLFGNAYTIEDLTIKDSYIETLDKAAGGIVAAARGGNILNCHNINTTVKAGNVTAGGIAGQATLSEIKYCTNSGNIESYGVSETTGNSQVGGIIGIINNTTDALIEECVNKGNVIGKGKTVGGIVGHCGNTGTRTFNKCDNYGKIYGQDVDVGGIVGYADMAISITYSNNHSNVIGDRSYVGGIGGSLGDNSTITNCYNYGNVTGKVQCCGGIVGFIDYSEGASFGGNISNCVNFGQISGENTVGGIAGAIEHYEKIIENSYNIGKVTGNIYVGGLVGELTRGSIIRNCYNAQEVTGTDKVGGILGYSYYSTDAEDYNCQIINCYNIKNVIGSLNVGGILGYNEDECEITNSYYLDGTATLDEGNGTSSILKTDANYIKTTFLNTANTENTVWEIREGINEGFPVLIELTK